MADMPEFDVQDIIDGVDATPFMRAWAVKVAAEVLRGQGMLGRTPADSEMTLNIMDLAEWIMTGRSSLDDVLTEEDVELLYSSGEPDEPTNPDLASA